MICPRPALLLVYVVAALAASSKALASDLYPQGVGLEYVITAPTTAQACVATHPLRNKPIKVKTFEGTLLPQCLTGGCSVTANGEPQCDNTITCIYFLKETKVGGKQYKLGVSEIKLPENADANGDKIYLIDDNADGSGPRMIVRGWLNRKVSSSTEEVIQILSMQLVGLPKKSA